MLAAVSQTEGSAEEQTQLTVMYYSGYMGWSIYGALGVFNTMYYFDVYKRQYMDTSTTH